MRGLNRGLARNGEACQAYLAIDVSGLIFLVNWLYHSARSRFLGCLLRGSG